MREAGPNTPVFILCDKRINKVSQADYTKLEEEAQELSALSGDLVLPEYLLRIKRRKRRK